MCKLKWKINSNDLILAFHAQTKIPLQSSSHRSSDWGRVKVALLQRASHLLLHNMKPSELWEVNYLPANGSDP
jgi:hypothetical protein